MVIKRIKKEVSALLVGIMISGSTLAVLPVNAESTNEKTNGVTLANTDTMSTKTGQVTATSLKVREEAGTEYKTLGSLKQGDKVEIVLTLTNGWYKIKYNNGYGYVSQQYVKIGTSSPSTNTTTKTGQVTATSLKVRKEAGTSATTLGTLKEGAKVEIVSTLSSGWYKIKYNNGYGYVSQQYVKIGTSSPSTNTTKTGQVTATSLKVRKEAGTSAATLGTLKEGAKVEIVSTLSSGWYKIKYNNGYGYVSQQYVKLGSTGSSSSSTVTEGSILLDGVSVRSSASFSGKYLGSLYTHDRVQIVQKLSSGWYKVKYKNGYGYIYSTYIKLDGVNITPQSVIDSGEVTETLSVRKGSGTSFEKLGTIKKGTRVQIVQKLSNGWFKIQYNNGYGYISGEYIDINDITVSNKERKNLDNFLFVGDSFTYKIKDVITAKNNNVYVKAQSGSRPSYWLDKVNSMPSNNSVAGVTVLIGVNGVNAKNSTNIKDTKALIDKLVDRYPDKKIYVQKVFPVGKTFTEGTPSVHNAKINTFNKEIKAYCNKISNVKFIDATSGFVSGGYLINTSDGLHINSANYTKFYNNIFNAIKNAEK